MALIKADHTGTEVDDRALDLVLLLCAVVLFVGSVMLYDFAYWRGWEKHGAVAKAVIARECGVDGPLKLKWNRRVQ